MTSRSDDQLRATLHCLKRALGRCPCPHHEREAVRRLGPLVLERWHNKPTEALSPTERVNSELSPGQRRFLQDIERTIGLRPTAEHRLVRIERSKPFGTGNLQWVEQEPWIVQYADEAFPLMLWAERLGVSYWTLRWRLLKGWSVEEALRLE